MFDAEREKRCRVGPFDPVDAYAEGRGDCGRVLLKNIGAMTAVPRDGDTTARCVRHHFEQITHEPMSHAKHEATVHAAFARAEDPADTRGSERKRPSEARGQRVTIVRVQK